MRRTEPVTLHFDLSHCPSDVELTLNAGNGRHYVLTRYADAPGKLDQHRRQNRALALLPQDQLHRVTHFVEDAELEADFLRMRSVVYPSKRSDAPLPDIAVTFIHIPRRHRRRALRQLRARGVTLPPHVALQHFGVALEAVAPDAELDIHLDASLLLTPAATAQALVFHHPEIGTTNPVVAQQVFAQHIQYNQEFQDLKEYIASNGPESQNPWYQQNYATWKDPDTGQEVPAVANDDLTDSKGNKVNWPQVNGQPVIPQYELSDWYNASDQGVTNMVAPVVQQVLIAVKNDDSLNGQLWTKQHGVTQQVQTNVSPTSQAHAPRANRLGDSSVGWTIKNKTSSYGLNLYADQLVYTAPSGNGNGSLSFPVKNWPNRYLGAYVQFLKTDGTAIARSDIDGWTDPFGNDTELTGSFEPDGTKNFIAWLSSGNQVFGVPFPTDPVTLDFVWPQDATKADVLLGGLGAAEGFADWDTSVDVVGVLSTGALCYGITALSMAMTINVTGPFLKSLGRNATIALYAVAAAVGAAGLIYGIVKWDTSTGKWVLCKLAGQVASILFGAYVKYSILSRYVIQMGETTGEFMSLSEAEEVLEDVPYFGWALKIASVASDAASLLATTIESIASPSTYKLEITRTMDLTVTLSPDPAHAKPGEKPIWPLVADHYVITLTYPSPPGKEGGTSYALAGPMPGDQTAPIVVTFRGVPAGGQCDVVGNVYSDNDWIAGHWESGWLAAIPDPSTDQLATSGNIIENLVPLTATTSYSQKQRVAFDPAQEKHIWEVTQFSIDASLASDLDNQDVSDALRTAFQSNGNTLSPSGQVSVTVNTAGSDWTLADSGTGTDFHITKVEIYDSNNEQLYELRVQNTTNASPQLPPVIAACDTSGDNHNICSRVSITINNREYELGYTWQASGQNMPLDDGTTNSNDQMFTFQAISTLGEPEDQIIEPSRGFSQRAFLAFDQFGITPLFSLSPPSSYTSDLDRGGPLSASLSQAFASYSLPSGAQVTPVTVGQEWLIGVQGADPIYDLKLETQTISGQSQQVVNVYGYPIPAVDNYYVDPRTYSSEGLYHLRGVTFPPGRSTFDYTAGQSWGAFFQTQLNAVAVHPQGYAVGIDYTNHKLMVLRLPAQAVDDADAPLAMALSGQGVREGLMYQPVAMTITADGRILILEQGNQRIQAFDPKGNPVPCFSGPISFGLPASFSTELDARQPGTDLIQQFQQQVTPARSPLFSADPESAPALDAGTVDTALTQEFQNYGYTLPTDTSQISVTATTSGSLWLVTDLSQGVTYDVRLTTDRFGVQDLDVYYAFVLDVRVNAPGQQWTISDTTNAMTFAVQAPTSGGSTDLAVQQLVATMALRPQQGTVTYQDIAVEMKGYIYVLATVTPQGGSPVYQLDIYNPDGTPLLAEPQTGVNAAKLTVDQWRTMFTLNYERVLGPGARTEPGVSAWIPSTPDPPSGGA